MRQESRGGRERRKALIRSLFLRISKETVVRELCE